MRTRSLFVGVLATIVASGLVVSCGDPTSSLPTSPSLPSQTSVTIAGPENVAPGQSVQFAAQIRLSDGSSKTASTGTNVRWLAQDPLRLQVDASGLTTAQGQVGDTTITAVVTLPSGTLRATKDITIVPAGTYRLAGSVNDVVDKIVLVTGARVEVTPGTLVTTTGLDGRYRLYGVPADATVRVTAPGYAPLEQSLRLTSNATQNFFLSPDPPQDLSGPYTLTVDATGCAGPLAAEMRHRTYDASLAQTGSTIDVRLTEPRFVLDSSGRGTHFTGRVIGSTATFVLEFYYLSDYYDPDVDYYSDVAERLSDRSVLVVSGTAVTTVVAGAASGYLNGFVNNFDSTFPAGNARLHTECYGNHRFTLTPR